MCIARTRLLEEPFSHSANDAHNAVTIVRERAINFAACLLDAEVSIYNKERRIPSILSFCKVANPVLLSGAIQMKTKRERISARARAHSHEKENRNTRVVLSVVVVVGVFFFYFNINKNIYQLKRTWNSNA